MFIVQFRGSWIAKLGESVGSRKPPLILKTFVSRLADLLMRVRNLLTQRFIIIVSMKIWPWILIITPLLHRFQPCHLVGAPDSSAQHPAQDREASVAACCSLLIWIFAFKLLQFEVEPASKRLLIGTAFCPMKLEQQGDFSFASSSSFFCPSEDPQTVSTVI